MFNKFNNTCAFILASQKIGYQVCETQKTPVLALFEQCPPQENSEGNSILPGIHTLGNARKAQTFFCAFSCGYCQWDVFFVICQYQLSSMLLCCMKIAPAENHGGKHFTNQYYYTFQ